MPVQFDCTNTLNDQLLENVTVALETGDDGFEVVSSVPIAKLGYNQPASTYTCVALDEDASVCGESIKNLESVFRDHEIC